jgi:3-hydroxyacyl-CoA dehydrogenase/3a,7a,12a-trihydroxy-5b-cholest-24-enoyl-CoA hydratase
MSETLRFENQVAVITGAGNGLGRSHALLFGRLGARVVVNDVGASAADAVAAEIRAAGGTATSSADSVEQGDKIVQTALDTFGKLDIVVNNAGILRDASFAKMSDDDWNAVFQVHVFGAFKVTRAAWPHLRANAFGRVVFTASGSGLYGNFGQANYSAAKMALVGMANTLALEGVSKNVRVNTIAPIAASRMTESVLPAEARAIFLPEFVSPLVAWLCHPSCDETGGLFEVGGGRIARARIERTRGVDFGRDAPMPLDAIREALPRISDFTDAVHPTNLMETVQHLLPQ